MTTPNSGKCWRSFWFPPNKAPEPARIRFSCRHSEAPDPSPRRAAMEPQHAAGEEIFEAWKQKNAIPWGSFRDDGCQVGRDRRVSAGPWTIWGCGTRATGLMAGKQKHRESGGEERVSRVQ